MNCIHSHEGGVYCDKHDHGAVTVGCCGEENCPDREVLTNGDKIRAMTDEELAETMSEKLSEDCLMCPVMKADCPVWEFKDVECKTAMLNWLKAPAKEGEG